LSGAVVELKNEKRASGLWLDEGRRFLSAARSPELYIALAAALVLFFLGYRTQPVYTIDVGGTLDLPFTSGMNATENNSEFNYRWTTGESRIDLPGIGRQDYNVKLKIQGWRPNGEPSPALRVRVNGEDAGSFQTTSAPAEYDVAVKAGQIDRGDLSISLETPTFSPENDSRDLGVVVDWVKVEPAQAGSLLTLPAPGQVGWLLLAVGLAYVTFRQVRVAGRPALWASLALSLSLALLLAFCREWLTIFSSQLVVVMGMAFLLAVCSLLALDFLRVRRGLILPVWQVGGLVGLFVLAFVVRYGVMVYPQFLSSDLGFHVHRLEYVLNGNFFFSAQLPSGADAPYPPAYYILLAPFAWVVQDRSLLLRFVSSLLEASGVFVIFYLLRKLRGDGFAGIVGGIVYAFSPIAFLTFSAGNYTNIFGQYVSLLLFAALALMVQARRITLAAFAGVTLLVLLTFTSHYGMLLAAFGAVGVLVVYVAILAPRALKRNAALLALSLVIALAIAYALYYSHFNDLILAQISAVSPGAASGGGHVLDLQTLLSGARAIARLTKNYLGLLPAVAGLVGLVVIGQRENRDGLFLVLLAWFTAAAVFAVFGQVVDLTVRYHYFVVPAVAIGAGSFFSLLWRRGWAGLLFVSLSLVFFAWQGLSVWYYRAMFTYH
jgi:hypothetical protein